MINLVCVAYSRYIIVFVCFFFFQAEDGIRDAQESRGLGDVYKRQIYWICNSHHAEQRWWCMGQRQEIHRKWPVRWQGPVSYTHLTLPTIYSV